MMIRDTKKSRTQLFEIQSKFKSDTMFQEQQGTAHISWNLEAVDTYKLPGDVVTHHLKLKQPLQSLPSGAT